MVVGLGHLYPTYFSVKTFSALLCFSSNPNRAYERRLSFYAFQISSSYSEHPLILMLFLLLFLTATVAMYMDEGPLKGGDEILPRRTGAPKREARPKENSPGADLQLSRPPSSFVKRSPIPVPYTPKEKISEVQGEGSPIAVAVKDMELQRVDEMKLIELKELAKSRGLKGYSKLKKGELVEQLKRFLQS
eukprot:TRINITY_DN10367_c0_g1_i6.p1 TRINITY_DN10367_c0_g1~~TRINITY_DN10367_c0_g1_i6.p1  ORF type:complete len:190 (-),score=39.35 TRINITY_DN10367_c0_g1_i6:328-897(-)